MRLRSLRRLEEMEIRKEHKSLTRERRELQALLDDAALRWRRIAGELEETRTKFGSGPLGNRRTTLAAAPAPVEFSAEAFVEREPITVILSEKGWVRAVRGHLADGAELKFKEGDKLRLLVTCETTDRLCLFGTNGRAYTLRAGDLPRGRGDGQPIRLLAELGNADEVVALFVWREAVRYLVASVNGRGFVVKSEDLLTDRKAGKQVLNVKPGEEALLCVPAEGDLVAAVGENRKLLVFPLDQVPELARGTGVILQRYADGGMRGREGVRIEGRAHLEARRQDADRDRSARLEGRARPGRQAAASGLSEIGAVRVSTAPVPFEPHRFRAAAVHYLAGRVPYPPRLIARVAALTGLERGHRVMDLGCGPGQLARAFAPGVAEVVAVDPEPAMLELARDDAPGNMRVLQGSSYDLGPAFGRFHLVVMGRSFHWMDRPDTLRRLDALIEPDGALALFADRHPELPANAWLRQLREVTDRYVDRASHWRGPDWVRHEAPLLESAFSALEEITVIERRSVSAPELVERVLSMSSTSREKLGDAADRLAAEIEALHRRLAPDGALPEVVSTYALIARRPRGARD